MSKRYHDSVASTALAHADALVRATESPYAIKDMESAMYAAEQEYDTVTVHLADAVQHIATSHAALTETHPMHSTAWRAVQACALAAMQRGAKS